MKIIYKYIFTKLKNMKSGSPFEFEKIPFLVDEAGKLLGPTPLYKGLNIGKYKFEDGDKIYITPGCKVPRIKIKNFKEAGNNLAVTIKRDNANKIITSIDSVRSKFEHSSISYYDSISSNDFVAYIKAAYNDFDHCGFDFDDILTTEQVLLGWTSSNTLNEKVDSNPSLKALIPSYKKEDWNIRRTNSLASIKDINAVKLLISDASLYDESSLNEVINSGSNPISEDDMELLGDLFTSPDQSNVDLAMELLANCDYANSIVKLELLFLNFHTRMNSSKSKNHVNFKALMQYMDIKNVDYGFSLDSSIERISEHKTLTQEDIIYILNYVKNTDIKSQVYYSNYFNVSKVKFTSELNKLLGVVEDEKLENVKL